MSIYGLSFNISCDLVYVYVYRIAAEQVFDLNFTKLRYAYIAVDELIDTGNDLKLTACFLTYIYDLTYTLLAC